MQFFFFLARTGISIVCHLGARIIKCTKMLCRIIYIGTRATVKIASGRSLPIPSLDVAKHELYDISQQSQL